MKVLIEESAKKYIDENYGGTINIGIISAGRGCCTKIKEIKVSKGVPEHDESYDLFEEDGTKIYIYKRLKISDEAEGIKVKIRNLFFIKDIVIEGIEISEL